MTELKGYIRHFKFCNDFDPSQFVPFFVNNRPLGNLKTSLKSELLEALDIFEPLHNGIGLKSKFEDFAQRSAALASATDWLCRRFKRKPRKEMYPVIEHWGDEPLAQLDRIAVPWFGIPAFGVHINGMVHRDDGLYLWIGERSKDRLIEPGKLDNMTAGGQPIGLTLEENLCKEGEEEAGLAPDLMRTATKVNVIKYKTERAGGLRNDVLFVYDLEIPSNVTPQNRDGEVAGFHLMSIAEVADLVRNTDRFKFNCNLVIIDFLVRHGFIVDGDRELAEIKANLG